IDYQTNGLRLGKWVSRQRQKIDKLSEQRRQQLSDLGFTWSALDSTWDRAFSHLLKFHKREGHCRVPEAHKEDGFNLGEWVGVQYRNRESVSKERQKRLETLGFKWRQFDKKWERGLEHLAQFQTRTGHCRVPYDHTENGFSLGSWVARQRRSKHALSAEQRSALDALGFDWTVRAVVKASWDQGFSYLERYYQREGNCSVPKSHKEEGFPLGQWAHSQRQKGARLHGDRRQRLEALGFVWRPRDAAWENGFRHLKLYKDREGHCRVPQQHLENEFQLGSWVNTQRTRRSTLSTYRK